MSGTAIFDLDRTLTRLPTWSRFVWRLNRSRPAFWLQLPWLALSAVAYKAGMINRTEVKNRFLATLAWAGRERIEAEGRAFAQDEIRSGLRKGVHFVIAQHRTAGDQLYLATAAIDFIAIPIAEALGVENVICTRTDWSNSRHGKPVIAGENCYGAEKLRQVSEKLTSGAIVRPIAVYSDHVSDLTLILLADRGVAVNPSAGLRNKARKLGFPIMDLNLVASTECEGVLG